MSVAKLILKTDGDPVVFPLIRTEILIGRLDSADLVLEDPAVSRLHAKVVWEEAGHVLVDLESSVGTSVNDQPVTRYALRTGDVIRIANATMVYEP